MNTSKVYLSITISMSYYLLGKSYPEFKKYNNRALSLSVNTIIVKPNGDDSCPCIPYEEMNKLVPEQDLSSYLGPNVNQTSYGFKCAMHDLNSKRCSVFDNCDDKSLYPEDCELSGCNGSWCYVDKDNCSLVRSESKVYENAYLSYATCGSVNTLDNPYDYTSLKGKTFNVALNANTGGWTGKHQ